jgi:hypothetical protein
MTTRRLPVGFGDLEPFAEMWCLPTEPERWERRLASSMDQVHAFYDACFPRAEAAIQYLDAFELTAMPDDAARLLQLLYSLALVSYVVEVWQQPLPVDIGSAQMNRLREPQP